MDTYNLKNEDFEEIDINSLESLDADNLFQLHQKDRIQEKIKTIIKRSPLQIECLSEIKNQRFQTEIFKKKLRHLCINRITHTGVSGEIRIDIYYPQKFFPFRFPYLITPDQVKNRLSIIGNYIQDYGNEFFLEDRSVLNPDIKDSDGTLLHLNDIINSERFENQMYTFENRLYSSGYQSDSTSEKKSNYKSEFNALSNLPHDETIFKELGRLTSDIININYPDSKLNYGSRNIEYEKKVLFESLKRVKHIVLIPEFITISDYELSSIYDMDNQALIIYIQNGFRNNKNTFPTNIFSPDEDLFLRLFYILPALSDDDGPLHIFLNRLSDEKKQDIRQILGKWRFHLFSNILSIKN
jgi:hypothetical protein